MATQLCKVVRGFWHAGRPWGEGEEFEFDANTASLLKGNGNVVFIKARTPEPVLDAALRKSSKMVTTGKKVGAE